MDPALTAIHDVRAACVAHDGTDPLDEAAWLALKHHGVHGATLAWDTAGFALVRDADLVLAVAPSARGRGLGGRLADDVRAHAQRAWSHGDHPAAQVLATRWGWTRARELWVMRRPTSAPLPPPRPRSDGVQVRGFRESDIEAVLAINAAAFATHPEQGALDRSGFDQRRSEAWFDPAGLLIAVDADDVPLAFHWTKRHDDAHGEVYVVGVSPHHQGRGLGQVVTLAGLAHLAEQGVAEVHLYVEADNQAARALYEGLGFTHAATDTHVQYRSQP